MKKILITGGAGYISSSVIDILLNKRDNYKVIVLDNNWKNTSDTLIPFITNSNFEYISGDVTESIVLRNIFEKYKPDFCFNGSALVGFPICNKYKHLATQVNTVAACDISNYCHEFNTKLIFPSTGSVYKPGQSRCDEKSEVEPPSHYGKTKFAAEQYILQTNNQAIVHRYGTAMGLSHTNIRVNLLVNDFCYQSYINRTITLFEHTFLRSFIHVRDIAKAIVKTIEDWDNVYSIGKLFNVSNNDLNFTKGEIAEMIAKKLGTNVCYAEVGKDLDQRNYLMDNSLFYSTGFKPSVGIDSTLDELIKVAPLLTTFDRYK